MPFLFPFLLGTALALAAEPVVRLLSGRLHLRRGLAAGAGVTLALVFLLGFLLLLGALLVREAGNFARQIPQVDRKSVV